MIIRHYDYSVPFGSRPGSAPVERIVDHVVPLTISVFISFTHSIMKVFLM